MKLKLVFIVIFILFLINFIYADKMNLNGINIDYGKGVLTKENDFDIITIPVTAGSSGETVIVGDKKYENLKANSRLKLKNGELIEAEIYSSKESGYYIRGSIIKVPENSKLIFKDNKVTIYAPEKSKIKQPEKIDKSSEDLTVSYIIPEKGLVFENDIPIKPIAKNNELFFDFKENAFYIIDKGYKSVYGDDFKSLYDLGGIGVGGILQRDKESKIYIYSDGKEHSGNYISISKEKLIVGSENERVFANIIPGNVLGIKDINNLIFSTKNGIVTVTRDKLSSKSESFGVLFGNEYIRYNQSLELIYKPEYKGVFNLPDFKIEIFDKNNNPIVIGKINENNYGIDIGQGTIFHQGLSEKEKEIFSKMTRAEQIRTIGMNSEEASKYIADYYSEKLDPQRLKTIPDESKYKYPSGTIIMQYLAGGVVHSSIILNENGKSWVYVETPPRAVKVPLESYLSRFGEYFYYNVRTPDFISPIKFSQEQINGMISYANSQLGRPYGFITEPFNTNKPHSINCATLVGCTLSTTGEYDFTHVEQRTIDFLNIERFRVKK